MTTHVHFDVEAVMAAMRADAASADAEARSRVKDPDDRLLVEATAALDEVVIAFTHWHLTLVNAGVEPHISMQAAGVQLGNIVGSLVMNGAGDPSEKLRRVRLHMNSVLQVHLGGAQLQGTVMRHSNVPPMQGGRA